MRLVHIITSLEQGGAQSILFNLIKYHDKHDHVVISLTPPSFFSKVLANSGIKVYHCNITSLLNLPHGLKKLRYLIGQFSPDVVQTWMYHSDLIGGLIAKSLRVKTIVWGIHHTNYEFRLKNFSSIILKYLCALFSYTIPDQIICCAYSTLVSHKRSLFCQQKLICIPNGYNHETYYPDDDSRTSHRASLNISENCFVLGYPARFHEQKDHLTLFKCAKILADNNCDFKLLLAGKDIEKGNNLLLNMVNKFDLNKHVILLGVIDDMNSFYNSLDVLCFTASSGEACPNILSEAMLCTKNCVFTAVGDTNMIALPLLLNMRLPKDYKGLASLLLEIYLGNRLTEEEALSLRNFTKNYYSLQSMANNYHKVWSKNVS